MSEDSNEKKVHGMVAEFDSVDTLLDACNKVREAGYEKTDAYTPFPVHGIDKALGIKPTKLPFICLGAGLTGTATALVMQIWMNAINYPYIISGKPFVLSLPAFIPVAFELTVLFASFGAFFGMWALNKLPKFSNPIFTDPRFDRATDDKFFLYIDADDSKYNQADVEKLLGETGSEYVSTVVDDETCDKVPKAAFLTIGTLAALSVVPLLIVAKMRVTNSSSPRFHIFPDMDFSPAKDMQMSTTLFADGRAMRPDVAGTVARGQMNGDLDFLTGIDMEQLAAVDAPRAEMLVAKLQDEGDATAEAEPAAPAKQPSVMDTTPWLTENPLDVDEELLRRGQKYFGIYCSVCHGMNGGGNGLVNQRAQKILASTWITPSKIYEETLHADKYPDGKLFNTISKGIRKMPGYASQIEAKDRWAIVAYVRALQLSQNADLELVPEGQRAEIEAKQTEIKQQIEEEAKKAEQAAAEAK